MEMSSLGRRIQKIGIVVHLGRIFDAQ